MAINTVKVTAEKLKRRKKSLKNSKIIVLTLFIILLIIFLLLGFVYNGGKFTVTLDPQLELDTGFIIYEDLEEKRSQRRLFASELEFMDNISVKWLPSDLHEHAGGSNNGQNYISYTFYGENTSGHIINYWYEIDIDDVIRNVDEAIRIMVYHNGDKTIYGKMNGDTNKPEKDTVPFYSDKIPVLEQRKSMNPGDIDKFTIVIWLEGDDPDCLNNLIGGEIKMHMDIYEEHIDEDKLNEENASENVG